MGRKKSQACEMDVREKARTPLASRLDELCDDAEALRQHLGVSTQAVSQYRLGVSRPTLENLCKIADFYHVTTDYLLGRTDTQSPEETLQGAVMYTGLSEEAVQKLHAFSSNELGAGVGENVVEHADTLSRLISSEDGLEALNEIALSRVYARRTSIPKEVLHIEEHEKLYELAEKSGNEIVSRRELRELHLEWAAERIKAACRKME